MTEIEVKSSDTSFLEKKCSRLIIPKKNESKRDVYKRLTHLYLNNKSIIKIGDITPCINLTVLYLHENRIRKIENLDSARNLTHLYLQRNEIPKIENLDNLRKLRKLYIGHNRINVIEGLENLNVLEELHIEKQHIEMSDSICLDPRSILGIRQSLAVLNISHNNLTSLSDVKMLYKLRELNATGNEITNLEKAASDVGDIFYLENLSLAGNPIQKMPKYRDRIIVKAYKILQIDGKDVHENTRIFLKNFEKEKMVKNNKAFEACLDVNIPSIANGVAPTVKKSISKSIRKYGSQSGPNLSEAISMSMLERPQPPLSNKSFTTIRSESMITELSTETAESYLAWNRLPHCGSRPRLRTQTLWTNNVSRRGKSADSSPNLEYD